MGLQTTKPLKEEHSRYFLALIPPSPLHEKVMEIKAHFYDRYQCKAPLKSPAHITLHMPFLYKEKKEKHLIEKLKQFSGGQKELCIWLNGFGAFEPRNIFVAVQENTALHAFQKELAFFVKKELRLFNVNYKDKGYHAHMTVAFRDLKKALFPQAWAEFKDQVFTECFEAGCFWLLKHDGRQWHQHAEFGLPAEK